MIQRPILQKSRVLRKARRNCVGGIVLDNLGDVLHAIELYSTGTVAGSTTARDRHFDGVDGFSSLEEENEAAKFTLSLIEQILRMDGAYERTFGYEAKHTPFFETTLSIQEHSGKYLLEVQSSETGRIPEESLAEMMRKPKALFESYIDVIFSRLNEWFYRIDLNRTLGRVFTQQQLSDAAKNIVENRDYCLKFNYEGETYSIRMHLDVESRTAQAAYIVGEAWTTWDDTGIMTPKKPTDPMLTIAVKNGGAIVTSREQARLLRARDHLAMNIL